MISLRKCKESKKQKQYVDSSFSADGSFVYSFVFKLVKYKQIQIGPYFICRLQSSVSKS